MYNNKIPIITTICVDLCKFVSLVVKNENMNIINRNTFIIATLFMATLLSGCCQSNTKKDSKESALLPANTLSAKEKADGWQLLFDGKTMSNWRGIGITGIPESHWKVEDGCIRKIDSGLVPTLPDGQPVKGGDLITDTTFNNFILKFEWKVAMSSNSGVKYNVIEEYSLKQGMKGALGFEYQVIDDINNKDISKLTHTAASLYDLIVTKNKHLKPVGKFNTGMIVFNKNHGEHWLNGVMVVEYQLNSPEFQELFRNSKYRNYSDFNKHKVAHIALQNHGNDCWFRNIKIKRLKD